jgi:hypothetical protein
MRESGARRRRKRARAKRKRVSTGVPAAQAAERLRRLFPEVWAWYELLATARGIAPPPDQPPDRSVGSGS